MGALAAAWFPSPGARFGVPLCTGKATIANQVGSVQHVGRKLFCPRTRGELQAVLANHQGQQLTVIGARHSHNLPDTEAYVTLEHMDQVLRIDRSAPSVTFEAGATQQAILAYLRCHGYTLHVVTEEHEGTLVGAVCMDAHGVGYRQTQLLAGVIAFSLVDWAGKCHHFMDADYNWVSIVSNLQYNGVIYEMTYRVEPSFQMSVAFEWHPCSELPQCLASPDRPRLLTSVLPSVPGVFTLQHFCCVQPRWQQRLANWMYCVYKRHRMEVLKWVRRSPWLSWLIACLAPRLPQITAVSSNTDLMHTPRQMVGLGDVEFAVPLSQAVAAFDSIRQALDSQPVLLYNLSSGEATPFPCSPTYRQDVTYINVRFNYNEMDFPLLDALIRRLGLPLHRAKYQPAGWTNPTLRGQVAHSYSIAAAGA